MNGPGVPRPRPATLVPASLMPPPASRSPTRLCRAPAAQGLRTRELRDGAKIANDLKAKKEWVRPDKSPVLPAKNDYRAMSLDSLSGAGGFRAAPATSRSPIRSARWARPSARPAEWTAPCSIRTSGEASWWRARSHPSSGQIGQSRAGRAAGGHVQEPGRLRTLTPRAPNAAPRRRGRGPRDVPAA